MSAENILFESARYGANTVGTLTGAARQVARFSIRSSLAMTVKGVDYLLSPPGGADRLTDATADHERKILTNRVLEVADRPVALAYVAFAHWKVSKDTDPEGAAEIRRAFGEIQRQFDQHDAASMAPFKQRYGDMVIGDEYPLPPPTPVEQLMPATGGYTTATELARQGGLLREHVTVN